MKKLLLAPLAALFAAFSANAASIQTLTLHQPREKGLADVVELQTHRAPVAVIAQDALYGGVAGLAVGAGVALIEGGNWGRDLAVGGGVGLLVGGIFGAVDAASMADRAYPVGQMRNVGFSRSVSPIGGRLWRSNEVDGARDLL
jgi:hypothetical protein